MAATLSRNDWRAIVARGRLAATRDPYWRGAASYLLGDRLWQNPCAGVDRGGWAQGWLDAESIFNDAERKAR